MQLKKQFNNLKHSHPKSMPLLKKDWQLTEPSDAETFERKVFRVCDSIKNNSKSYVANNLYKTISTIINLEF